MNEPLKYEEAQWKALEEYVRKCADTYGLRDWIIHVDREEPDVEYDAVAQCLVIQNRSIAHLRFSSDFADDDQTADKQRRTIIHELTHCHLERPWEFATDSMEVVVGNDHRMTFERASLR